MEIFIYTTLNKKNNEMLGNKCFEDFAILGIDKTDIEKFISQN